MAPSEVWLISGASRGIGAEVAEQVKAYSYALTYIVAHHLRLPFKQVMLISCSGAANTEQRRCCKCSSSRQGKGPPRIAQAFPWSTTPRPLGRYQQLQHPGKLC